MIEIRQAESYPSIQSVFTHTLLVNVVCFVLGFPNSIVLARSLGAGGRGHLSLLLITAMFLSLIFGLFTASNTILVGREPRQLRTLVYHSFAGAIVSTFLVWCLYISLPHQFISRALGNVSNQWIWLLCAIVSLQILWGSLNGLLMGRQDFYFSNYTSFINGVLAITLNVLFIIWLRLDVTGALLVFIITWAVASMLILRRLWKSEDWLASTATFSWPLYYEGVVIGARAIAGILPLQLMFRSNLFLIQHFIGPAPVGIYTVAVNAAEIILIIGGSLNSIMFGKAVSERDIEDRAIRSAKFSLLVSLGFWLFLGITGWWLFPIAYGGEFKSAIYPCLVVMAGICSWNFLTPLVGYIWGKARFPISYVIATCFGFLVNFLFNLLFIPSYGIIGAALSTSIAYTLTGVILVRVFVKMTQKSLNHVLIPNGDDLKVMLGGCIVLKNYYHGWF